MIGDREHRTTDLGALWFGHGVELAGRMNDLAAWCAEEIPAPFGDQIAERIREELHDPAPRTPQLGLPPTLRPAIPPGYQPQPRRPQTEPGTP